MRQRSTIGEIGKTLVEAADIRRDPWSMRGTGLMDRPKNTSVMVAVIALLILHASLALWGVSGKSTTADEILHLTAGFSFWELHDYRLHPENGILPQRWAALPAWIIGAPFPLLEGNSYWRTSESQVIGHQFFYEMGHDHFPMLMAARAMIVVFSVGTGILIFIWSKRLFGNAGGLLSLSLFALCPSFLAHGSVATSDVCMVFFFLASCGAWWRHLHSSSPWQWALSAIVFGLACVAKHSAMLLLPVMAITAAIRAQNASPFVIFGHVFHTGLAKFGGAALSAIGHGVVASVVIWACYGFRYEAFNPSLPPADHFIRPWEILDLNIGFAGKFIRWLAAWHALPEAFLYGTAYVIETAQVRSAFLNGEYSTTGWMSFFPWAFVLKSTLPVLLATILVPILAARRWRRNPGTMMVDLYRVTPLAVLFAVYWAFSLTSHLNIGHRHILPTYPVLFIAAGCIMRALPSRAVTMLTLGVLVLGQTLEAFTIAPHFLAYFNVIGGGPKNGFRHLVDSSLDWGQDLPGLKKWLDENAGGKTVYLSYFGTGEPDYYRIRARRLPFVNNFKIAHPHFGLEPGIYCISATMLQNVYSSVRGPWTIALEKEFLLLRGLEPTLVAFQNDSSRRKALLRDAPAENWDIAWGRYEQLRFARLCHYLRVRESDSSIGHSILIYRLSAEEINLATVASLREWSAAIDMAVTRRSGRKN
jgi:4-amino-4-deoxy-L-arabinose transferase-like glycosyltransferase